MNMKKVIIVALIGLMALGCVSTVSAGWFDFLKQESEIEINSTTNGSVFVGLKSSNQSVENKTIDVNISTDKASKSFTVNTTSEQALVCNLVPGEYKVSASFAGDDQYLASNATQTVTITELSQGTVEDIVNDLSKELSK